VRFIGPYAGQLSNGGETVRLFKPVRAEDPRSGLLLVDEVRYDDRAPWPREADGGDQSLTRRSSLAFGNLAANWQAKNPSPGVTSFAVHGDLNLDGGLDDADAQALALALRDDMAYEAIYGVAPTVTGDLDRDGDVDFDDLDEFTAALPAVARVPFQLRQTTARAAQAKEPWADAAELSPAEISWVMAADEALRESSNDLTQLHWRGSSSSRSDALIIAQRFIAGYQHHHGSEVPEGRLNPKRAAQCSVHVSVETFNGPSGTGGFIRHSDPAINRWAIVNCPYGTKRLQR
jgi:hypothetical protein